jgi:methyl-accepting chemotaxis protein
MAGRTAEATDHAAADAEAGRVAVERTVAGMGGIEKSANQAAMVIRRLTEDVGKIGGILEIIQEVTDQTNLLALNASILAAQAGEHGKGFAVVATEIKELAERTARSTNEITDLIRSIQDGALEAGQAMANGIRHIDDGVARSREAGEALQKILDGTQESSQMTREIVDAATEHASQSRQMTSAIKRINETVTRIASTTQEQARGCTSILQASEQMRDLTALVRKAILDQKQGSRRISTSVEQINVMARAIDESGQRQKGLSERVVGAMGRIGSLSHGNVASLAEMDEAVRTLTQRAEELRGQISRFRDGS